MLRLGDGGGYDWEVFSVFRDSESDNLYFGEDAGCSCRGPYEYFDKSDFTKATSQWDIVRAAENFAEWHYSVSDSELLDFKNKLHNLKED